MVSSNNTTYRTCSKCHIAYLETEEYFQPQVGCRKGLRPNCRECDRLRRQTYYAKNAERLTAYARDRRKNEPEKVHAEQKAGRQRNHDKILARNQKYRVLKTEKVRAMERRYGVSPKGKARTHRRYAREHHLPSEFTAQDWEFAMSYWNNGCVICGRPQGLWHKIVPDHWIPLTRGGGSTRNNLLPMCHGNGGCNNSKCDTEPVTWLQKKLGPVRSAAKLKEIQAYFRLVEGSNG